MTERRPTGGFTTAGIERGLYGGSTVTPRAARRRPAPSFVGVGIAFFDGHAYVTSQRRACCVVVFTRFRPFPCARQSCSCARASDSLPGAAWVQPELATNEDHSAAHQDPRGPANITVSGELAKIAAPQPSTK